jgi:shikimate kinase
LKRAVVLIGLMGSGKTSVGRALAGLLGWPWEDLDQALVKRYGRITEQFRRVGEPAFRKRESAMLKSCLRPGRVLSTGGGVVLARGNRARLKRHWGVYLQASPQVLAGRLKGVQTRSRPLLKGAALLPRLASLSRERARFYRESALFSVQAGRGTPLQVAQRVLRRLRAFGLS